MTTNKLRRQSFLHLPKGNSLRICHIFHGRPYFMSHLLSHSLFHYLLLYSNTIKTTPQNRRYEYEWADLWIIATFPSRHYDIESYPAVKNYLLSIGIERLEQTGETHIVNGKKIKARKKTRSRLRKIRCS